MAQLSARLRSGLVNALKDLRREAPEAFRRIAGQVHRPDRLAKFDETSRMGQILALFFLGPVIVVNLALIVAVHDTAADVLSGGAYTAGETVTVQVQWFTTMFMLVLFAVSGWSWFQFVRTGAFGFFGGPEE